MIKALLRPWPTRLLLKRMSKWVILITLALSIMIAGVSIYAENVGNFVISINRTSGNTLLLSEDNNFENDNGKIVLFARALENLDNATYGDIPLYTLYNNNGNHSDLKYRRYFAYSFYIKNVAQIPLDYKMSLDINDVFKGMDEAIRVKIVRLEQDVDQNWIIATDNIYAKWEKDGSMWDNDVQTDLNPVPYQTTRFHNYSTVCAQNEEQFGVGEVYKYVVVIWLEGNDPDCIDTLQGGMIRMTMNFEQTSKA